jgi:thioester reductase-like protein
VPLAFVTGFPGFIGRRLVEALLEDDGMRVVALVEARMLDRARVIAAGFGEGRVELLAGDIRSRGLGIASEDWSRLARDVTRIYHLAAVYDLAVPVEVAQRVNVDGTGNVLELCLAAERLERLVYVSTAYVAGLRSGVVYEHELGMGQGFKNHYESTKFQAEVWVRELMPRIPTVVVRPAIVVGDSRTGETDKFDGPYYILRTISRAVRAGRVVPRFGGAAPFNVVPVDFVVAAIAAVGRLPEAVGTTLHLVDPDPLTAEELLVALSTAYAGKRPLGRLPARLVTASLGVKPIRDMLGGTPRESIAYLSHKVTFDSRRAVDVLSPHGLAPPRFSGYVGPMVEYFRAHERDPMYTPNR